MYLKKIMDTNYVKIFAEAKTTYITAKTYKTLNLK